MESKENVQQLHGNKVFKVEEELLIIPYSETPNLENIYTVSNIEHNIAKLPDHVIAELTNRMRTNSPEKEALAGDGVVQKNMQQSTKTAAPPARITRLEETQSTPRTASPARIKLLEQILKKSENLFKRTNWRLCRWIYPRAPRLLIQKILDHLWNTISREDKKCYISQVLDEQDKNRRRSKSNPQRGLKQSRRYLKKDRRLDLLRILPPPQPVASVPEVQKFNQNCSEAQSSIASSVSIESNDGIENSQNERLQKTPKLDSEMFEPDPKSSSRNQEFVNDPDPQEVMDKFKKG